MDSEELHRMCTFASSKGVGVRVYIQPDGTITAWPSADVECGHTHLVTEPKDEPDGV
jgi:hypothetical protein